jgi:hypothetical protein
MIIRKNTVLKNGTPKAVTTTCLKEGETYNLIVTGLIDIGGHSRDLLDKLSMPLALGYSRETMGTWHVPYIHQICDEDFRSIRNILRRDEAGNILNQSRLYDVLQYCSMALQLIDTNYAEHIKRYSLKHEHKIENGNQEAIPVKFLPTSFFKALQHYTELLAALTRLIGVDGQRLTDTTFVDIMTRYYHEETMSCLLIPKWDDIAGNNKAIPRLLKTNKAGNIKICTDYDFLQYMSICLQFIDDDYSNYVKDYCFLQDNCVGEFEDDDDLYTFDF